MEILREPEVERRTGLSRSTLRRKEHNGTFPERVQLGENSVGWRSDEVESWLQMRPRASGNRTSIADALDGFSAELSSIIRGVDPPEMVIQEALANLGKHITTTASTVRDYEAASGD